jgi:hypothetical protein
LLNKKGGIKMDILESIQEALRDLDFIELNSEERSKLRTEYNTSAVLNGYAINPVEDLIMFVLSTSSFGSFEYYYGMEYEREFIKMKLQYEDEMIIGYDIQCSRAMNLIKRINPDIDFEFDE